MRLRDRLSWVYQQDLSAGAQSVLLYLTVMRADSAGECYPGQRRIAEDTRRSERAVRTALTELEQAGLITRCHRSRQAGRATDWYTVSFGAEAVSQPAKSAA